MILYLLLWFYDTIMIYHKLTWISASRTLSNIGLEFYPAAVTLKGDNLSVKPFFDLVIRYFKPRNKTSPKATKLIIVKNFPAWRSTVSNIATTIETATSKAPVNPNNEYRLATTPVFTMVYIT